MAEHRHFFETLKDGTVMLCVCGAKWADIATEIRTFQHARHFALDPLPPPERKSLGQIAYEAWSKSLTDDGQQARRWIDLAAWNRTAWERAVKEVVCEHVARCIGSEKPAPRRGDKETP